MRMITYLVCTHSHLYMRVIQQDNSGDEMMNFLSGDILSPNFKSKKQLEAEAADAARLVAAKKIEEEELV